MDYHWGSGTVTHQRQHATNTKAPYRFQKFESRRKLCLLEQNPGEWQAPSILSRRIEYKWLLSEPREIGQQRPHETVFELLSYPSVLHENFKDCPQVTCILVTWPGCIAVALWLCCGASESWEPYVRLKNKYQGWKTWNSGFHTVPGHPHTIIQ